MGFTSEFIAELMVSSYSQFFKDIQCSHRQNFTGKDTPKTGRILRGRIKELHVGPHITLLLDHNLMEYKKYEPKEYFCLCKTQPQSLGRCSYMRSAMVWQSQKYHDHEIDSHPHPCCPVDNQDLLLQKLTNIFEGFAKFCQLIQALFYYI